MKIKDIVISDIYEGKNWRITNPSEFEELELEDLAIEEYKDFQPDDYVVYSSIFADEKGVVTPRVMIKQVGSLEYGGDMCEFIDGKWQRVGLNPNPNVIVIGEGFIANPLANDPSFDLEDDNDEEREYNKTGFNNWVMQS